MVWKKVSSEVKELEKGESMTGTYLGSLNVGTEDEINLQHSFETNNGVEKIWGSMILDRQLTHIPVGTRAKVTYLGKIVSKNNQKREYHNYGVEYETVDYNEKVDKLFTSEETIED